LILHTFTEEAEKDWIAQTESLGDSIVKLGRCEINVKAKLGVGFQSTTLDSWIQNHSEIRKPQNTFDSRCLINLAADRFESSFYQPLPLGTVPNATIVPSWFLQPILNQIQMEFSLDPSLELSTVDYRRWYGFYRTNSTFTVKWITDKKVLLSSGDSTSDLRSYWAELGSYEKAEFRIKHYYTGRKFDRLGYFDVILLQFNELPSNFSTWLDFKTFLEQQYSNDQVTLTWPTPTKGFIEIKMGNKLDSSDPHNYYLNFTGVDRFATRQALVELENDSTQVSRIPRVTDSNPTLQTPTSYPWWTYEDRNVSISWSPVSIPISMPLGAPQAISYRIEYCKSLEFAPSQTDLGSSMVFGSRRLDSRASGQTVEVMGSTKMIINMPTLKVPFLNWDDPSGFGYNEFGESSFGS
jgi:hypothetical protein